MTAETHLARAFLTTHPGRAARALAQMPAPRLAAVLRAMPAHVGAKALRAMPAPTAADGVGLLTPGEAAALVAELTTDEAAVVIRTLAADRRESLLNALTDEMRERIMRVLPYADGTAGAVMDPAVFQLPDDVLVAEARVRLGRAARELLYYVYIVDHAQRLVGVLDIPELMLARPRARVSAVIHRDVERLNVWMPVALVREHDGWQRYHAMPVVDDEDRLLGAIRYQALRRLEREALEGEADPARLTAGALAELFQLGAAGIVAGIAAAATGDAERAVAEAAAAEGAVAGATDEDEVASGG